MCLIYTDEAERDLLEIAALKVLSGHPDPDSYVYKLQQRLHRQHEIRNPGVVSSRSGCSEWILAPMPYIAVVVWDGGNAHLLRVLSSSRVISAKYLELTQANEKALKN